ncbi:Gfo/Idh/MocA family protein [Paenibacillus sp. CAU 1782]
MQTLRVALIGCGNIAKKHVDALLQLGAAFQVTAICDSSSARMEEFAAEVCRPHYPNVKLFTSWEEMLAGDDAELIVIATGSDSHGRFALQGLRAGRHVLAEKPLSLSLKEAKEAAAEAKNRGLVLAVSFQARYLPQFRALKAAVEEGRLGMLAHGIVSMRWNRSESYYGDRPWRDDWSRGGGLFMNQCIHYIDLLQWLMGPVVSVHAEASVIGQRLHVENTGAALLRFASGAIGLIEASTVIHPPAAGTSISLYGHEGAVCLGGARLEKIQQWSFADDEGRGPVLPETASEISHVPLYRDLATAIAGCGGPLTAAETTLHSLEIVLAVYESIASGKTVLLPIDDFDMVKMAWME